MTYCNTVDKLAANGDEFNAVFLDTLAEKLAPIMIAHLENLENVANAPLQTERNGEPMATKINRAIMINGEKRWIHANTEQEYAEKLLKLCGTAPAPAKLHDFAEYAQTWFELYSAPNITTATATTYKRQIDLYLVPHFKEIPVEHITVDDVQRLFNGMNGTKATKDKARIVLSMILDAAVEDHLLERNPVKSKRLKITGRASSVTEPYTVEEMRYMVKHLDKITSASDLNYFVLLLLHPLRLEEVLGLKWADIDTDSKIIHVHRAVTHPKRNKPEVKETKTAASERSIRLAETALAHLTPGAPDDFVCGGKEPLSYTLVRRMNERIAQQIEFNGTIVPRRFRTTVLTDLYDQTKDIKQTQAAAGHTTSAMTLKHYVKGRQNGVSWTAAVIDSVYTS